MNNAYIPKYQMGGLVGPDGMPQPTSMPQQGGMPPGGAPQGVGVAPQGAQQPGGNPQMLEMQINQFMKQHPEQVAQLQEAVMTEMQSGEMTAEELNQLVQLATVAAQNPEMYPNIRQHAIQQGIATEQDLPEQYDQALVFALMLAGRAAQQGGAPQGNIPSMAKGGPVPGSKAKADGGVVIEAHKGEYVIPENVVAMKGKEFFDNLVEKYKGS